MALEQDLAGYKTIIKTMTNKTMNASSEMFNLYGTLLSEEKCLQWEGWVKNMTKFNPWVDLQGQTQVGICRKTCDDFDDCIMHHLTTIFGVNAVPA